MSRALIIALVVAPFYVACAIDAEELGRPEPTEAPTLEAPPPPAEGPAEQALYQALFAGELGPEAHALGQRARMLAWFEALELTDDQLRGLVRLSETLARREAAIADAEEAAAAQELAVLQPVYTELLPLLQDPSQATEAQLSEAGARLAAAREEAGTATVHRVRHDQLRAMLEDTRAWTDTLDETQKVALDNSRFLLRHEVGPLSTPGDHADILGTMWDGAAFDTLILGRLPTDEEPLDIGGIWASEDVRNTANHQLGQVQRQILTLLAARQEGLVEAVQVRLGEREATDFSAPGSVPTDPVDPEETD